MAMRIVAHERELNKDENQASSTKVFSSLIYQKTGYVWSESNTICVIKYFIDEQVTVLALRAQIQIAYQVPTTFQTSCPHLQEYLNTPWINAFLDKYFTHLNALFDAYNRPYQGDIRFYTSHSCLVLISYLC